MNILVISTMEGNSWGGSEELWYSLVNYGCSKNDYFNIVLFDYTNKSDFPKLKTIQDLGYNINLIPPFQYQQQNLWSRILNKILKRTPTIQIVNRFQFLNNVNYDYILLNQGYFSEVIKYADLWYFIENTNIPIITLNQLVNEFDDLKESARERLVFLFKKTNFNFFSAKRNLHVVERLLCLEISNSGLVKNPLNFVDTSLIDWPVNEILQMAVVGRLDCLQKGIDILLYVLSTNKWKTRSFHLNIYGTGVDYLYLTNLVKFYHLELKVTFKGYSNDFRLIWKDNHVLVQPSIAEGLPLSLVGTMLLGRPALVTDVGDCATLINHKINGFVSRSINTLDLLESLEQLWQDKNNLKQMGLVARETVLEDYSQNLGELFYNQILNTLN